MGSTAFPDVSVTEPHGQVIGQLRQLKALQLSVAAVQRKESVWFGDGLRRSSVSISGIKGHFAAAIIAGEVGQRLGMALVLMDFCFAPEERGDGKKKAIGSDVIHLVADS